jgi:cytochrome b subunit of formate dehydrogenase
VTLVITGFPMKFADRAVSAWFIDLIGGLGVARLLHRWAGALLLACFIFHLVFYVGNYVIKQGRKTNKSYFKVFFSLPLVMSPSDFKKMGQYLLFLTFLRRTRPKWGRFSLEEKFEYFGVMWGTILLGITGILMWDDAWTTRYLSGRTLTVSNLIHSYEAFLALLHVGIVHLARVIIAPAAFPCSSAMFTGDTPTEELAEAHSAMIDDVENQLSSPDNPSDSAKEDNHA